MVINTKISQETTQLGKKFSRFLQSGDVVLLEGDLGGGKTTFIKGVLDGLRYKERVLSPSFTLVRQYQTKKFIVHHADLYRLDKNIDLINIGLDEYMHSFDSVCLIEWGEKIEEDLDKYIKITFLFTGETKRKIIFSHFGLDKKRNSELKGILK